MKRRFATPLETTRPRQRWWGHQSNRWHRSAAAAVLMLAVAGVVGVAFLGHVAESRLTSARADLEALRQRASALQPAAQPQRLAATSEEQARVGNSIIRQLNAPWSAMLNGLESTASSNIALISVETDGQRGTVRIVAEAKSADELIAYLERLRRSGAFSDVAVVRHDTNARDPRRPARFSLEAAFRRSGAETNPASSRPGSAT